VFKSLLRRPVSFSVFELALIAVFLGGALWVARASQPSSPEELLPFAGRYGREKSSQYAEEWLIRDFFETKRNGVFVDVGASHYRLLSNTYYLETALGWSGLAVEPLRWYEADYLKFRPRTKFRPFFVSDVSDKQATMYVLDRVPNVTSANRSFTERWGKNATTMTAPTITLTDLLTTERIERFDFLNMDIELWEPKALAGFDIARFRPTLVCIEAHAEVRQQIIDYFTAHAYTLVGKYLRADIHNLYFTPLGGKASPNEETGDRSLP
jgi:FkbM family methyltransferase